MRTEIEGRTMRKIGLRLIPFLGMCYFFAWLDRVNVGMAALSMKDALGMSATVFGAGAGVFFWGLFFFEVPSNLAMRRFGARRWIARIMVTWGALTMAMSLVVGEKSFLLLRFLLGAAEAGFFPGIVYYMTYWFPDAYRGRSIGAFMTCGFLASIIGPTISTLPARSNRSP